MVFKHIHVFSILLLFCCVNGQNKGSPCQDDSDCNSWLACVNNICTGCGKIGTTCSPSMSPCCEGSYCLHIEAGNFSQCVPNNETGNCVTDADCSRGLKCVIRLNKCGICKNDNEPCSMPYDDVECCSNFCDLSIFPERYGVGLCKRVTLNSCTTSRDCQSNFDCRSKRCVKCQRNNSFCRVDSDCCSGKCERTVSLFMYNSHHKECVE